MTETVYANCFDASNSPFEARLDRAWLCNSIRFHTPVARTQTSKPIRLHRPNAISKSHRSFTSMHASNSCKSLRSSPPVKLANPFAKLKLEDFQLQKASIAESKIREIGNHDINRQKELSETC